MSNGTLSRTPPTHRHLPTPPGGESAPPKDCGLRVMHVITGLTDGGAEAVLYRLVTANAIDRHIAVSLTGPAKYDSLLTEAGTPIYLLGLPRGALRLGALWRLWRLIRTERPDIVQTWMYHGDLVGGLAARLAGTAPVVWGIRNTTLDRARSKPATIAVARMNAWLSRLVPRRIICCSERAAEVHQDLGYSRSRIRIVPNGYDCSMFRPDQALRAGLRRELGIADDEMLIGMVARFDSQKDHATLLSAIARLKGEGRRFRCLLVGGGMTAGNAELARLLADREIEDRVILLGPRTDIPAVMNALDIHVLSSAYGEAFPNVVCEAMACGTPCVVTDVGDAAIIVGDTGWVVPPSDPEAMARALGAALDAAGCEARSGAAVARIRDNYSLDRMVEAYREVWREALQG